MAVQFVPLLHSLVVGGVEAVPFLSELGQLLFHASDRLALLTAADLQGGPFGFEAIALFHGQVVGGPQDVALLAQVLLLLPQGFPFLPSLVDLHVQGLELAEQPLPLQVEAIELPLQLRLVGVQFAGAALQCLMIGR